MMSMSRVEMLERSVLDGDMSPAQVEDRLVNAGIETLIGRRG